MEAAIVDYNDDRVKNYQPSDKSMFMKIKTGDYQRLIWAEPLELTEREINYWQEFQNYIKENNLDPIPEEYVNSSRLAYRFLQGCGWKNDIAYNSIFAHQKWRAETFPIDTTPFTNFLTSGAVYVSCRAKDGLQPVVFLNLKVFIEQNKTMQELEVIVNYYFDWVVENMMVPGHVENWMIVIDMKDVSLTQLPISSLKGFIKSLQSNFRGRMFRLIACNSHLILRTFWNAVCSWLDQFVQQKIIICGYHDCTKNLLEYIDIDDLEVKYGGNKPNITEQFFPPQLHFFQKNKNEEQIQQ